MGSVLVLLRELSHVWFYGSDDEAEPLVGGDRGGKGGGAEVVN